MAASINGVPMQLDLSEYIQKWVFTGTYEVVETSIIQKHLTSGGTFIDVGANIGYYSSLALAIVGKSGRVIAIEPTPELGYKLTESFSSFRDCVTIIQAGLGKEKGVLHLYLPPKEYRNINASVVSYCEGMSSFKAPLKTLDEVITEQEIKFVNLLKIDVEGCEPEVLVGGINSLRSGKIGAVLIEINDTLLSQRSMSAQNIEGILFSAGFIKVFDIGKPSPVRNSFFKLRDHNQGQST